MPLLRTSASQFTEFKRVAATVNEPPVNKSRTYVAPLRSEVSALVGASGFTVPPTSVLSAPQSVALTYTGGPQYFKVPEGATNGFLDVQLSGAGGASHAAAYPGGAGGYLSGRLAVTPGEIIEIRVGGGGNGNQGGYGGGGAGWDSKTSTGTAGGGGGGGRTSILRNGVEIAIAGGGGGGGLGGDVNYLDSSGGAGGGLVGGQGGNSGGTPAAAVGNGYGGTQSDGGIVPAGAYYDWVNDSYIGTPLTVPPSLVYGSSFLGGSAESGRTQVTDIRATTTVITLIVFGVRPIGQYGSFYVYLTDSARPALDKKRFRVLSWSNDNGDTNFPTRTGGDGYGNITLEWSGTAIPTLTATTTTTLYGMNDEPGGGGGGYYGGSGGASDPTSGVDGGGGGGGGGSSYAGLLANVKHVQGGGASGGPVAATQQPGLDGRCILTYYNAFKDMKSTPFNGRVHIV